LPRGFALFVAALAVAAFAAEAEGAGFPAFAAPRPSA
jgi:hypothetical protein